MSRIGFDKKIHPYQLQLRLCTLPDLKGIQNKTGITLDFREGKIINYHTDEDMISTTIKECVVGDADLKELYTILTIDAVEEFEATPESELSQYMTGYYDWAALRYLMICGDGRISDGVRHNIYSNDPIKMTVERMRKTAPFKLDV